MECSICGISDKMRNVSDALSSKGIVQVCDRCAREEGLISLKKPKIVGETERETMYQRMARLAGVKPREQQERTRPGLAELQEKSLREIVDKNYEKKMAAQNIVFKPRPDLVDNFHWIIMRVRRVNGLTQKQLAERISEPEAAIKMAEQGVVPEGYALIDKLERFLGVRLIKQRDLSLPEKRQQQYLAQQLHQQNSQQPEQGNQRIKHQPQYREKMIAFDRHSLDSLTISDLKRMRQEREARQEEEGHENIGETSEEQDQLEKKNYDRLDYE